VLAACLLLAGCGGTSATHSSASQPSPPARTAAAPGPPKSATASLPPPPKPKPKPRPSPGSLPQTDQQPSAGTLNRAKLWAGVHSGSLRPALAAFFPEHAYVQLKRVGDPKGDFENRLVADFRLDLEAAHALVGSGARLVDVRIPSGFAHWVPPGVCDNGVGYWEVPNARVVYRAGGALKSFGIASMISWRGVWYVVHLGSVLRPAAEGLVNDPEVGPGASAPSSTC
jgi:hypothetical protein